MTTKYQLMRQLVYLNRARDWLDDENHWTQRTLVNENGATCAVGALRKVIQQGAHRYHSKILWDVASWLHKSLPNDKSLPHYNDTHTHAEVLEMFDKAINLLVDQIINMDTGKPVRVIDVPKPLQMPVVQPLPVKVPALAPAKA